MFSQVPEKFGEKKLPTLLINNSCCHFSPCVTAVHESDRDWEPLTKPGERVSLGLPPAETRHRARRVPRPRHLPHQAGFWSIRHARCVSGFGLHLHLLPSQASHLKFNCTSFAELCSEFSLPKSSVLGHSQL